MMLVLATTWFYQWTVDSGGDLPVVEAKGMSYYNLLARGFLKGQMALDLPADPFLATLKNPYNPAERQGHGLHDASYFQGKYYLYFGASPAVLLFVPFELLTGRSLNEPYSLVIFAALGCGLTVVLMRSIIRRAFPATSLAMECIVLTAVVWATMVAPLLRRPGVWEVPICCAYVLTIATLLAVWHACTGRNRLLWALAASLAVGLCIGARPVFLFGGLVLAAPLGSLWMARRKGERAPSMIAMMAVLTGPVALVGLSMAYYNYARFGRIGEFGHGVQMTGDDITQQIFFSVRYFAYNARAYLFCPPTLTPFFPFVSIIDSPRPLPDGHIGIEDPFGAFPAMPWLLLGIVTLFLGWRHRNLAWWCAGAWCWVVLTGATVFCFAFAANRYMVDFIPGLAVLAGVGALQIAALGTKWPRVVVLVTGALAGWSVLFNIFASIQHNRLLKVTSPAVYTRLAHAFNHLPEAYDRLAGTQYGPIELKVVFPKKPKSPNEALLATGRDFLSDYIYINYDSDDRIRIGFEHTSFRSAVSPAIKVAPGVEHTVVIQMGSLFPPREHPYFDGLDVDAKWLRASLVCVTVDDKVALRIQGDCYDPVDREADIGTSGSRPGFRESFSGKILSSRRVAPLEADPVKVITDRPVWLGLKFPRFTGLITSEPLLCSGEAGKGDLVYVRRVDEKHIVIGHDRWGYGGSESAPITIEADRLYLVQITCPPLVGGGIKGLEVKLDGAVVFACSDAFHPCRPQTVEIGQNPIGSSMAVQRFSGEIVSADRNPP